MPITTEQYQLQPGETISQYNARIAALRAGPTNVSEETPTGDISAQEFPAGDLGNLRIALRSALNEAARKRVESNFKQVAPLSTGVPGTIGAVVDMIRAGVKSPVETTFSDIMTGYENATEAKQKEIDRINELRAEFGSAVPSSITDLKTALDLVAPLVDKERRLKLEKMAQDQTADNDVESAAEFVAQGGLLSQIGGSSDYKAKVRIRAEQIKKDNQIKDDQELRATIISRIERKALDFDTAREVLSSGGQIGNFDLSGLSEKEIRDYIDFVDNLEQQQKAIKKAGGKGLFSLFSPATATPEATPAPAKPSPMEGYKPPFNIFNQ